MSLRHADRLVAPEAADAPSQDGVVDLTLLQVLGAELIEHSRTTPLTRADRQLLNDLAQQLTDCAGEDAEAPAGWARKLSQQLRDCAAPPARPAMRFGALRIAVAA